MITDPNGCRIDYDEQGEGPTIVLAPGSCSTGAAWRPIIAALGGGFRFVTTSLPGYGGTDERRVGDDMDIARCAESLEAVIRKAGGRVHLVGHSFGGLTAFAVALRKRVQLASLTVIEAPFAEVLRTHGDARYADFRAMTDAYFADFNAGNRDAIEAMIDFYGGAGTWKSWPEKVRAYAAQTTPVNHRDWASVFGFAPSDAEMAAIDVPAMFICGADGAPAVQRANELAAQTLPSAHYVTIARAAHFLIATHAAEAAALVREHVQTVEAAAPA